MRTEFPTFCPGWTVVRGSAGESAMKSGRKKGNGAQGRGNLIVPDQRLNGRWEGKSAPAIPLFSECRFPTGLDPRA